MKPDPVDETVLLPILTIQMIAEEAKGIIQLIPSCHHSAYLKQIDILMTQFEDWCENCPVTLPLECLDICDKFKQLKQKFLDLVFEAHTLTKNSSVQSSLHWDIQYQAKHIADSHQIEKKQKHELDLVRSKTATKQHSKIIRIRAKMAITANERVTPLRWTEPNGLDVVAVYFCDQQKIANFFNASVPQCNVKSDWIAAVKIRNQEAQQISGENIEATIENESPPKRQRVDNSMML